VRPVKTTFSAQPLHVDTHPVLHTSGQVTGQLIDPHLPHRAPLTARRSPNEVLAASAGSVYAVLDAQEDARPEFPDLGRDRAPQPMTSRFESLVPDRPDPTSFSRRQEYDLIFDDGIARGETACRIHRGEQ
jgi:hypothetical protein